MRPLKATTPANLGQVTLTGGFWKRIADDVREKVIPYQWEALNDRVEGAVPSHCVHNFKVAAGLEEGEFGGLVFQDSDLAKWLEAAAYSLATTPDADLERTADELISIIEKAQQSDGYLNTYFTLKAPDKRWTDLRDCHELYCAGHMMEAAVAYYEATGKRALLNVMHRMAAHIQAVFGREEGKLRGYPGHQEIELALVKMYRATGDEDMLRLAKYFIDERGQKPNYFELEHQRIGRGYFENNTAYGLSYAQSHLPVREQRTLEGHSVRGLYMLSGMLDVARETGDAELLRAAEALFENATTKRMYVTGGVGSTHIGEAFSFDYDLPNDTVYAETCASIALVFAAHRLLQMRPNGTVGDVLERALYNTCIAGMSLDGKNFFYVNPLEVLPEASRKDPAKRHVLPVRPKWFGCACCPPNLARLVASLGQYVYSADDDGATVHLFVGSEAELTVGEKPVRLKLETGYPYDGAVRITTSKGDYALRVRLPGWCRDYQLTLNGEPVQAQLADGYLSLRRDWADGDALELMLDMPPYRVYANPLVPEDVGKVCVMRGPLVYCAEEADNGKALYALYLAQDAPLGVEHRPGLLGGVDVITATARKRIDTDPQLYRTDPVPFTDPQNLTLIPYYAWANRGEGEMAVWLREG